MRYTFNELIKKTLQVHVHLLEMQPQFQNELGSNLSKFKQDKIDYCDEYHNAGPMQSGLTPREASDRLILFQVRKFNFPSIHRSNINNIFLQESI